MIKSSFSPIMLKFIIKTRTRFTLNHIVIDKLYKTTIFHKVIECKTVKDANFVINILEVWFI